MSYTDLYGETTDGPAFTAECFAYCPDCVSREVCEDLCRREINEVNEGSADGKL